MEGGEVGSELGYLRNRSQTQSESTVAKRERRRDHANGERKPQGENASVPNPERAEG